jgi:glycosyltransferase involved in cell wall biosynthesis
MNASMLVQEGGDEEKAIYSTTHGAMKRWINMLRFVAERLVFLPREKSASIRFLFSLANTGENLVGHPLVKEADIIHLHWINAGFLSLRSLEGLLDLGKPVVWTFHDMWPFTGGCHYALDCKGYARECGHCPYLARPGASDLSHKIWKRKEKLFGKRKFTVITPSRWLKECVRASSLLSNADVHAIHNPVDSFTFQPVERERACRSLNLDPGKRYILFGAATMKNVLKGYPFFKDALELLKGMTDPDQVEIILFGKRKGRDQDALPFKTHNVAFVGSLEKLTELYSVAHLFVIPSLQDNLPNTILESMLCGTPVVGFKTGGIPEMIDHQQNGYLADFKSHADLARGMEWILSMEGYDSFSRETRERTLRRFSKKEAAEAHLKLYKSLLDKTTAS